MTTLKDIVLKTAARDGRFRRALLREMSPHVKKASCGERIPLPGDVVVGVSVNNWNEADLYFASGKQHYIAVGPLPFENKISPTISGFSHWSPSFSVGTQHPEPNELSELERALLDLNTKVFGDLHQSRMSNLTDLEENLIIELVSGLKQRFESGENRNPNFIDLPSDLKLKSVLIPDDDPLTGITEEGVRTRSKR